MPALWTLDAAKADLRVSGSASNADISGKIDMATAMVLDFITEPDEAWSDETVPGPVRTAIMLTVRSLYDEDKSAGLPDDVKRMLRATGYRDPALA